MAGIGEPRGHAPGQETLQVGKRDVDILGIEPVGNYAIRIIFDDGHDSGLFAWDYLRELATNQEKFFKEYLQDLKEANASRLPSIPLGHWSPKD